MKQNLSLKIKLIYLPYLLISIATLVIFIALRFLLSEHWNLIRISTSIWDLYLPLTIIVILVLRYLRPRFRILSLGMNSNGFILYNLIAIATIFMPVYYGQQYISTAPHKLHHLKSLNDIDTNNVQKYYTIDNYGFENNGALSSLSWVSGSFKKNIQYKLLTATPAYDTIHPKFKVTYWYTYEYDTVVGKTRNRAKIDTALYNFVENVRKKYDDFNPKQHVYLEALRPSTEYYNYATIIYAVSPYSAEHPMVILKPVYTPFNQRSGNSLLFTILSFLIGITAVFWMVFFPSVRLSALRKFRAGYLSGENILKHFFSYLIPGRNGLYATPIIIWCCIILQTMIWMAHGITALGPENMVLFGGNYLYGLIQGEIWRLITYMFLHADLYHLLSNMLYLGIAGAALEPLMKSWSFVAAYLFTGIAAGIISAGANLYDVSAGASGAIFGLYGTMLGLLIMKHIPKRMRTKYTGILWLYAFTGLSMSFQGNVDAAAHIGGLLIGILFGIMYAVIVRNFSADHNRQAAY